ncbi:MAG: hypothetical protein J5J00_13500 [Deltaproteobacteria bacterium]|nr:hypothetical protein [Deltaproteobacteria bacterium]
MKSFSATFSSAPLQLHRLLRRHNVDKAVVVIRIVVLAAILALAILIIHKAVGGFFSSRSAISQLEKDVAASLQPQTSEIKPDLKRTNYKSIVSSKLLGELGAPIAQQPTPAAKPPTQLSLQLIGTFISGGQAPYAIIEDSKKKVQDVFMVSDPIFDQAKLRSIFPDRVEIEHEGRVEVLKLDDTPDTSVAMKDGVATVGDNEYIVEEAELDKALENLPLLLTQARAVPYFKDGKSIGLRMFAIRSSSIFEKIGLRNGDVLKSINGNNLGDLSQAVKLFERLKEERSLSLILERNNEEKEFKYQIR